MYRLRPVANGTSTDHPVPGLPFINDGRLPLDNPDAIERTGRNQGQGLWGRTDPTENGGWVAFTTEPKNPSFCWAVFHHPPYGRTVLLIRDSDQSDLHYQWKYGGAGFLHRHGGYWWNGERWHRPAQVRDAAFESYDPRPVEGPTTITAASVLNSAPSVPQNASILTIASFSAPGLVPNWTDHLALWAQRRASQPGELPLDACVVDLHAPELEVEKLVGRVDLARIASISTDDLPHPKYGRNDLPEPQEETDGIMRWSVPVARDWAEDYLRYNGPEALLSDTTVYGTTQPVGLVADHNRLRRIFHETLTEPSHSGGKKQPPYMKGDLAQSTADDLAWDAAIALMYGSDYGLIPHGPLREVLVESIMGRLAEDVEERGGEGKSRETMMLSDMPTGAVKLLTWYLQRRPGETASILGDVCLRARVSLDLHPAKVGALFRRSLSLDSDLDSATIDALLDMALPPSARDYRKRM
ncbi:hypothetical protein CP970_03720 [Streptomyces kanamyceticus]|uniref:Uncharacterized protein n=1 Tax=Streptomyces kanamyceticus TaxID=1967 RepID=A0A5J6G686_STRKN|nr:hypothetical protein [Streptomyces kanamyceticus]QEU90134.1 hypothetical protein CP970_03720 [Streptomyces kanamyceticus]